MIPFASGKGAWNARRGRAVWGAVQLCRHRGAGSEFAPPAGDPRLGERGARRSGRGVFSALRLDGRPSIPPEKLLRAMLLQAFYSIRSERQLMERQPVRAWSSDHAKLEGGEFPSHSTRERQRRLKLRTCCFSEPLFASLKRVRQPALESTGKVNEWSDG